jgi:hypothetical protein
VETGLRRGYWGTARRKRRQQTNRAYRYRATSLPAAAVHRQPPTELLCSVELHFRFRCYRTPDYGDDEAPPGTYFTTIHPDLVQEGHKNRVGIYAEQGTGEALFLDDVLAEDAPLDELGADEGAPRAVHADHFYLRHQAPETLGTVAFALCAMTAHRMGYSRISLIAGGGRGHDRHMIGYFFWPKLGFDAPLEPDETGAHPQLAACRTVQDVMETDEAWWRENGWQRWMEFDLAADSRCWGKLLDYLREKELI